MIEITYADMFLLVVIAVLAWKLIRARVEFSIFRNKTLAGLYALHEGEAEVVLDKEDGSIRLQEKEKVNV
jgi:23S rRNA A2030 N6-methylase RlmJ